MTFCDHVYNYSNSALCSKCGNKTHDIVWDKPVINDGLALKLFQDQCCASCSCK